MVEVFLIQTDDRLRGLKGIFSHFKPFFESLSGKHVVIKPNFNTADTPPASTDIQVVREVINHLKSCNAAKITVAAGRLPLEEWFFSPKNLCGS
jgi:uncharacterized protein (DUF362 family)